MRTRWTSRAFVLLAALTSSPAVAQEDDEATVVTRPEAAQPRAAVPDDEATEVRRGEPDEQTVRTVDPDEQTVVQRIEGPPAESAPVTVTDARFNGYLYEKFAVDTQADHDREDVFDNRLKLGMNAEVGFSDLSKGYLSARFSHLSVGERDPYEKWYLLNSRNVKYDYKAELMEAYVYLRSDWANLRVGSQIVRWGLGEVNKPSDVLNPVDFREGLFNDLEVPLIPVFMVHVDRTFGPVNVSAVWLPFFTPNRMNLFGQDWAPMAAMAGNPAYASFAGMQQMAGLTQQLANPGSEEEVQGLMSATNPPQESLQNGQWGGSLRFRVRDVEGQICYLYGWDKLPWLNINSQLFQDVSTVAAFGQKHPEFLQAVTSIDPADPASLGQVMQTMQGLMSDPESEAEFAAAMASLKHLLYDEEGNPRELTLNSVFETSYKRQQTIGLSVGTLLFDTVGLKLDGALSPLRTVFLESPAGFAVPAQKPTISYSVGLDYTKGTWFDILGEFYHFHVLDMDPGQEVFLIGNDLYMVTLASHVRFLDFDALEVQLAGMMELSMRNLFLFPKVSYKIRDEWKVGLGAVVVEVLPGGDEQGPAGLFDHNDAVYADLKWSF